MQDASQEMLDYLNQGGNPELADVYENDIDADLKGCDLCLTEEQIAELRDYYVWGGIFNEGTH